MPQRKHSRGSVAVHGFNGAMGHAHEEYGGHNQENRDPRLVQCCVPSGCCRPEDLIHVDDAADAVKVICNNDQCTMSPWMHGECFFEWEQTVLNYLRSCGRARSWSEKQRMQNLWTKKGYDLAFKACDCKCGRGHLRKDIHYCPMTRQNEVDPNMANRKPKKTKKKNEKPMPVMYKGPSVQTVRPQLRVRTNSLTSTGSSPPSSAGTGSPPGTPGTPSSACMKKSKFDFFADPAQAAAGNIFKRRSDYSAFNALPRYQQNPYHIKLEDEGPHGNDEIRSFLLSNLSIYQVTSAHCVVCNLEMNIYDRYPLIDGTFFLSPMRYNSDVQVMHEGRVQYLNAACMRCLEGMRDMRCLSCHRRWTGSTLVLGTMYAYDIFAATPCCQRRLACKNCNKLAIQLSSAGFQFYSQYSRPLPCQHCKTEDYHFVKPLAESFYIKQPICK